MLTCNSDKFHDQAVSRRPLTLNTCVRSQASLYGIYDGQNGSGAGFLPSSSVFLCQYNSTTHHHHHQILLLLVEHRASMKSFQALRSPGIPLTSFHYLLVLLISFSTVLCHVLFGLTLLLYPRGFQSNAVFSISPVSLRNVSNPIPFSSFYLIFY